MGALRSRRWILVGLWLVLGVIALAGSLLFAPRALAPVSARAPQGTAELLSYYAAWWLLCSVGLGALAHRRGTSKAYVRGLAVTSAVMISSLAIAAAISRPALYPAGEYVNLGLGTIYLVLGALIAPNVTIGTVLLWRAVRLPLGLSLILCVGWAGAFVGGLALAEALVEILLVGTRRV